MTPFLGLALVYRHILDPCDVRFKIFLWVRRIISLVTGGMVLEAKPLAVSPILLGTDWTRRKSAATGWANILQRPIHAV